MTTETLVVGAYVLALGCLTAGLYIVTAQRFYIRNQYKEPDQLCSSCRGLVKTYGELFKMLPGEIHGALGVLVTVVTCPVGVFTLPLTIMHWAHTCAPEELEET